MSAKSKEDILRFYEDFRQYSGWGHLEALRIFLPQLFQKRELDGCTLFTSHETLCIVRHPTYPEWVDKPCLLVNCITKERLRLSLCITLTAEPVHRSMTEDVNCPLERGLEEFDRLYVKFLAAHKAADSPKVEAP